jgi:hypothetical protein
MLMRCYRGRHTKSTPEHWPTHKVHTRTLAEWKTCRFNYTDSCSCLATVYIKLSCWYGDPAVSRDKPDTGHSLRSILQPIWINNKTYIYIYIFFFPMARQPLGGLGRLIFRGFTITLRHTTLGRTPLDEWSARRRDLYLTTHNTHNRQTSMP